MLKAVVVLPNLLQAGADPYERFVVILLPELIVLLWDHRDGGIKVSAVARKPGG
jgi:hypothetical protein